MKAHTAAHLVALTVATPKLDLWKLKAQKTKKATRGPPFIEIAYFSSAENTTDLRENRAKNE